jgi:simple sugar transport system substrate-binding protein
MLRSFTPSRRDVLKAGASGAALALAVLPSSRAFAAGLTAGFIYVGPKDDYGYNQAHAEGAAALKSMEGLTIVEEENVPETVDVQKTMESMINLDGATLIFPTSFGYFDPHMLAMAAKYPDIQFRHCGGLWTDKNPANTGSYFGYIGMGQYLNGIVAGHTSKSKKIGFVAAKPIPQVLLNINSFTLGARSVDPTITTQVIFTGEWSLAVKEAEATNALIDQGVDVVTCHVDGPKVTVQTAAGRGAYVCGYHANQSPLAPELYLTGAEWNWAEVYKGFVTKMMAGEPLPNFVRGGIAERVRQDEPLRAGGQRSGESQCRRRPRRDQKGRLLGHQRTAQGQRWQRGRSRRHRLRRDGHRAREHELPRGGRARLDLLRTSRRTDRPWLR